MQLTGSGTFEITNGVAGEPNPNTMLGFHSSDVRAAIPKCDVYKGDELAAYVFIGNKYEGKEYPHNLYLRLRGNFFAGEFEVDEVASIENFGLPKNAHVSAAFCGVGAAYTKAHIIVDGRYYVHDLKDHTTDEVFVPNGLPLRMLGLDNDMQVDAAYKYSGLISIIANNEQVFYRFNDDGSLTPYEAPDVSQAPSLLSSGIEQNEPIDAVLRLHQYVPEDTKPDIDFATYKAYNGWH